MILSIGCSHSNGPYNKRDSHVNTDSWPQTVTKNTDEKHRHISMPGQGILSYYEVIKYLEEQDALSHIDKLLIQYSQEPRVVVSENPEEIYSNIVKQSVDAVSDNEHIRFSEPKYKHTCITTLTSVYNNANPNTILTHFFSGRLTEVKPKSETKIIVAELFNNLHSLFSYSRNYKNIFDLTRLELIRICERNNIKLFEFAWDWSTSHTNEHTKEFEKVQIIRPGDFMIVKEEFMKKRADILNIDYMSNKKQLRSDWDRHTNNIGHMMPDGEKIVQQVIVESDRYIVSVNS